MRRLGITIFGLALALLVGAFLSVDPARASQPGRLMQEGTPTASPVTPEAPPAETPAPTEAPAPTPAPTDVVTLVAWYALDPTGEFLAMAPIQVDPAAAVANVAADAAATGRADLPADSPPSITLGDSRFLPYNLPEDNPSGQRWTWFDGEEGARPATLVIQVAGIEGTYDGYIGTATFVSRDDGSAGGVLVMALRPPGTTEEETPAEAPPAEEAPVEEPADPAAEGTPAA